MAKVVIGKIDYFFSGVPPVNMDVWYIAIPDYYETFIPNPGSVNIPNPPLQDGPDVLNRFILDNIKTTVGSITGVVIKDSDIMFQLYQNP